MHLQKPPMRERNARESRAQQRRCLRVGRPLSHWISAAAASTLWKEHHEILQRAASFDRERTGARCSWPGRARWRTDEPCLRGQALRREKGIVWREKKSLKVFGGRARTGKLGGTPGKIDFWLGADEPCSQRQDVICGGRKHSRHKTGHEIWDVHDAGYHHVAFYCVLHGNAQFHTSSHVSRL